MTIKDFEIIKLKTGLENFTKKYCLFFAFRKFRIWIGFNILNIKRHILRFGFDWQQKKFIWKYTLELFEEKELKRFVEKYQV